MTDLEIKSAIDRALELVKIAGEKLIPHFGNVESESKKSTGFVSIDIVTHLDRETEDFLNQELARTHPHIGFRGEEHGTSRDGETFWLVDPIDGTAHFVRGIPFCTTMLALIEDGEVIGSIIYNFVNGDAYWAIKGQGAFKNSHKISVSNRTIDESLVSFETRLTHDSNYQKYLEVSQKTGNIISTINSGYELAMIAEGKFDAKIISDGYGFTWDFAPGSLLIQEAGGIVRNIGSTSYDYTNLNLIASNSASSDDLMQLFT